MAENSHTENQLEACLLTGLENRGCLTVNPQMSEDEWICSQVLDGTFTALMSMGPLTQRNDLPEHFILKLHVG
jgi:hypothetical protein